MEVPQPDDFQSSSFSHCLSFLNMALSRIWRSWRNPVMEVPQPDAHQSSSLPSSTACSSNYDVFLSFSGKDTRTTFTGHLYRYLVQVGIGTFMDDEELKEGEEIGPNLLKAITESRISIPIFSINYACSKWCLNELVRIMECREKNHQLVLPVFFYVNPGDVRKQIGGFGQKFHRLAKSFDAETVERWQKALKKAGQLKGWELKNGENGPRSRSHFMSRTSLRFASEGLDDRHISGRPDPVPGPFQEADLHIWDFGEFHIRPASPSPRDPAHGRFPHTDEMSERVCSFAHDPNLSRSAQFPWCQDLAPD